jgi:preprotein translocase subunit SecF
MRFFGKTNFDFMGKRMTWYFVSAAVIVIGMLGLPFKGLDYGIDFLGGTELIVQFTQPVGIGDVRSAMDRIGMGKAEIKSFGSDRDILIRTPEQGEGNVIGDRIQEGLKSFFTQNPYIVLKEDKIGPKIGAELRRDAIYAVIASVIAIGVYVWFRFRLIYGIGAVVALVHDVLVTLGLVCWFNGVFNLEINQNMIAAFLTLVGLSVNDTVVVFDRIRENQKIFKTMPLKDLMNKSLNETLSRTIITSGTIFIVTIVLLIFGGEVNRGFAFAMSIGIVTGTYSSIFVASAIALEWSNRTRAKGQLIS